jgi:hypothetical protein
MSNALLTPTQETFRKKMTNPFLLRVFLLFKIPLGFLTGMKVIELNQEKAISTVNFKWLNRNPFKSLYFGVQCMAAELCTGAIALMAIYKVRPSVAGIVTGCEAEFVKQAKSRVYFTCENGKEIFAAVELCKNSDEGQIVKVKSVGKTKDGTTVSVFHFTWSFKRRA